jgi:guanylate kinase
LRDRNTEAEADLKVRIARAAEELTYVDTFDRVLLNDDLQTALAEAEAIARKLLAPEA